MWLVISQHKYSKAFGAKKGILNISFKLFFSLFSFTENFLQVIAASLSLIKVQCVWQATEKYFKTDWVKPKRISRNCPTKSFEAEASCGCVFTAQHLLRRSWGPTNITSQSFARKMRAFLGKRHKMFKSGQEQANVENSFGPTGSF